MSGEQLSGPAARLADLVLAHPRRRLTFEETWAAWALADPQGAGRASRRADLAAAIEELVAAGVVTASIKQDAGGRPPLPASLTRPAPTRERSAREQAAEILWRPELAWTASLAQLNADQLRVLGAVNNWLRERGQDDDMVPLRERALEILGDEKGFDGKLTTGLFQAGRLSLDLLRTFRSRPPLAATCVADRPGILLVAENADTYASLLDAVRRDPGPVSWVAWGAGTAFEVSIRSVPDLRPKITEVRYFGDVDLAGVRIPAAAAETAARAGAALVLPAVGLYRLLLESGKLRPAGRTPSSDAVAHVTPWLGPGASAAAEILTAGQRIPQEAVGARALAHWRIPDLLQ